MGKIARWGGDPVGRLDRRHDRHWSSDADQLGKPDRDPARDRDGVLGRASFFEGTPSAILGLVLQWAMSLVIAAIYVMSCRPLPVLARRWVVGGPRVWSGDLLRHEFCRGATFHGHGQTHLPHFSAAKFGENMLACSCLVLSSPSSRSVLQNHGGAESR